MFVIDNLCVKTKETGKKVLNNFSIKIAPGEIHAIMGPNGVGKSTLAKAIMHHNDYIITNGSIKYNDIELTNLSTDEIARNGIYLLLQDPAIIEGVSNSEYLKTALKEKGEDINLYSFISKIKQNLKELNLKEEVIHASINKGLSGGERKKNEVLSLKMLSPSFLILDELDSGLDVDSLKIVANNINEYLKQHQETSVLMITHYSRILDLIKPNFVHEISNGKIIKTGNINLAKEIEKNGYTGINEIGVKDNNE